MIHTTDTRMRDRAQTDALRSAGEHDAYCDGDADVRECRGPRARGQGGAALPHGGGPRGVGHARHGLGLGRRKVRPLLQGAALVRPRIVGDLYLL
jgi:hypothetical protein